MSAPAEATPSAHASLGNYNLTHLKALEAESIHIIREVAAEFDNPVLLYSIGKDSMTMLHLARKAFAPAPLPFPLMHVDTTWNPHEMVEFRDRYCAEHGLECRVWINQEGVKQNANPFDLPSNVYTDIMNTQALRQGLSHYKFDAAFGGGRRDEERSRAKERIYSFRDSNHGWDPKNQRPELWNIYNGRVRKGESIRVYPLSNWTELDIWQYIWMENIPLVSLYFAKDRPVVERHGTWVVVDDDRFRFEPGEKAQTRRVRYRTLGCYPLSGVVDSDADTVPKIIQEMLLTRVSERQGRVIDYDESASMEKKKREGYY